MKFHLPNVTSIFLSSENKLLNNLCRYFTQMNSVPFLLIASIYISLFLMTASTVSPLFAQQDETNQTGEAGQSAMNQTGEAGQSAMNQTGGEGDILSSISEGLKGLFGMK
jgi:hypothetical protein